MSLIITVTFNPALDKSCSVEKLVPEQKLECTGVKSEPGGGGINVSRGLRRLGTSSQAVFPIGGEAGQTLLESLRLEGIQCKPVMVKNSTRENLIVLESSSGKEFRFGMPGPKLYLNEEKDILTVVKRLSKGSGYIVASGSVPPGSDYDIFARVAFIANKTGFRFIADTSGQALKEVVDEGVYLLKPNLRELSQLAGVESLDRKLIDDAARELIGKGKCEVVVVSLGADGAYLVTQDISEHFEAPQVKKLSTVGAGDSMVAGMIHALSKGENIHHVVRMGIACGTAATMNQGSELFKKNDAESLFRRLIGNDNKE